MTMTIYETVDVDCGGGGVGCGRVVGSVAAKSNVNVYHFSEDCEGPGPDVTVPRWSIEPEVQVHQVLQVRELQNVDIAGLLSLRAGRQFEITMCHLSSKGE